MNFSRIYIAIDLKSFYASVECVDRNLDPLNTNLVVADVSRTEKTICLAVSPSLKAYGISGRARLFEAVQRIMQINAQRRHRLRGQAFRGKSYIDSELKSNPYLELDYIAAPPRMAHYIEYSTRIYNIYLKYISAEDIHVYSIDEVFIDVTNYLATYKMTPRELAATMIHDVLKTTGITATAGIGTNLYLAKVAMDIVAKHIPADENGVRIAELDEMSYRQQLWSHKPLTDFWRVGHGLSEKLIKNGMYTMGDVAHCSVVNEDILYNLFGVNAELLIDHAWGWEPCTIDVIKQYKPSTNSFSSGQVLNCPYTAEKALVVIKEMTDALSLSLVDKKLVTDQLVLTVSYDRESLTNPEIAEQYKGPVSKDYYGRLTPKHAHGTVNLGGHTSSSRQMLKAVVGLYRSIVNPILLIRRLNVTVNHVIPEDKIEEPQAKAVQLDLFGDTEEQQQKIQKEKEERAKERRMQEALLNIKKKFGKNAILNAVSYSEGATARERNNQIGGHKA